MTDLRKIAQVNRNYYLSEKKADNGEDRWFRYVRTMESYSEPVLISHEMALELLEGDDGLRRPLPPAILQAMANDIKNGLANPTISINFSGKLLDSSRVLRAIVMNNESAIVFVSFNISDKLSFLFG